MDPTLSNTRSASTVTSQHQQRIPALDGLRGFAVLYVIVSHLFPAFEVPDHWSKQIYNGIIEAGWSGVDLFFVLSGFLITSILVKNRQSENYFSSFYARRVLRIVPLYYLLCVTVIFILPSLPLPSSWNVHRQPGNAVYYFLFLNNFSDFLPVPAYGHLSVCWSLAIEEQFYLVWPLLIWYLNREKALYACVALFIGTVVLRNLLYLGYGASAETLFHFTFTHLDGITIGSIAAIALSDPERYEGWIRFLRYQVVITVPVLIGVFLYCTLFPVESRHLSYQPLMVLVGYALLALAYCALMLHCVLGRSIVTDLLQSRIMGRFGKYSYAMYLLHFPAASISRLIFRSANLSETVNHTPFPFILSFSITYALAALSWYVLESRFNALKKRFTF